MVDVEGEAGFVDDDHGQPATGRFPSVLIEGPRPVGELELGGDRDRHYVGSVHPPVGGDRHSAAVHHAQIVGQREVGVGDDDARVRRHEPSTGLRVCGGDRGVQTAHPR